MVRLLIVAVTVATAGRVTAEGTPLRQEVYVWQRAWTGPVTNTVATLATNFDALIVLQAEVSWSDGRPRCTRTQLDYALLRSLGRPVGLALRIGSFAGPFTPDAPQTTYLAALASTLAGEAAAEHLHAAELQLDFDCAESKLDGYGVWLKAIQEAVKPVPVSLTALPSWLGHTEFKNLAEQAKSFVLQVHSFERPASPDASMTLCDPQLARQAVGVASKIGVPFQVALPTYGYLAGFTREGHFLGLSAEGPQLNWPPTTQVVEVRADAMALSQLVRQLIQERPIHLEGLVWYRLPMPDDVLNWGWPTLRSVMAGTPPTGLFRAGVRWTQQGLAEIDLANEGTAGTELPAMTVRWTSQGAGDESLASPRALAMDGLRGYEAVQAGPNHILFKPTQEQYRLRPGDGMQVGWVRFDTQPQLIVELDEERN